MLHFAEISHIEEELAEIECRTEDYCKIIIGPTGSKAVRQW